MIDLLAQGHGAIETLSEDLDLRKYICDLGGTFITFLTFVCYSKFGNPSASSVQSAAESNAVLKFKFQKLHTTVVDSVNTARIIDFLFQEGVLGAEHLHDLQRKRHHKQRRELLALLHKSKNPEAFVKLYVAIKNESHLQWLIDRVDQCDVTDLLQQLYISEPTSMSFDCCGLWN